MIRGETAYISRSRMTGHGVCSVAPRELRVIGSESDAPDAFVGVVRGRWRPRGAWVVGYTYLTGERDVWEWVEAKGYEPIPGLV